MQVLAERQCDGRAGGRGIEHDEHLAIDAQQGVAGDDDLGVAILDECV